MSKNFSTPVDAFFKTGEHIEPQEEKKEKEAAAVKIPIGYEIKPETKSQRVQVLMQPSIHKELKVKAAQEGISLNALINEILRNYLTE